MTRAVRSNALRVAALMLCCLVLAACGKVSLFTQVSEREANEMLAVLMRAGIQAEKAPGKNGTSELRVPSDRVPEAVGLLAAAGLPRGRYASMGDLFKREGLVSSASEERVRYIYGITQELSRTISTIDGVLDARVHVVLPNNDPAARGPVLPSTAAVLIRVVPGAAVEAEVARIKELVSHSIEGLRYDRVSVVLVRAAVSASPPIEVAVAASEGNVPLLVGGLAVSVLLNLGVVLYLVARRKGTALIGWVR
ncbi:MAG: type secretion protein [Candidatus Hydrogenedentes bacterium]|nr:type secretion protein [Candidatus Hydrogenedentota bacterium]